MRLLRLHVEGFGTLREFSLELEEPLTVLCFENGWGKSTLAVFIKAMLYGLPATSKRSLDENERKKYTPWQGGAYGGSIEFESEKGRFRAERFFGAKESGDTFALYDLDTHLESDVYSENLGAELFGIDADGYERTVYLSQRTTASKGENYSITAKLTDLLDDVDDIGGYDAAAMALDKRCKYYVTTGNRGRISVLESEIAAREREREGLLRVRAALEERERELGALSKSEEQLLLERERVRADLRLSGAQAERAALCNQREQLQKEYERICQRRRELDRSLEGLHPDEETLDRARRAAIDLRELSARLRELPEESAPTTELWLPDGQKKPPSEAFLEELSRENEALRVTAAACAEQMETTLLDGRYKRFFAGVPQKEELEDAFEVLDRRARAARPTVPLSLRMLLWLGSGASLLSLVLAIVSAGHPVSLICLSLSLVTALIGCIGSLLSGKGTGNADSEILRVRRLLETYEMPWEVDPYRSLAELSVLRDEYLRAVEARKAQQSEAERTERLRDGHIAKIRSAFSELGILLPQKEDYRDEILTLGRDISLVRRAKADALLLKERKKSITEALEKAKETLSELLAQIGCRQGQEVLGTIETVARLETEYRLLGKQEREYRARLNAFLEEHPELSEEEKATSLSLDHASLSEKEEALSKELNLLSEKKNGLLTQIERLSFEADRIPDAEGELASLSEELSASRENSETVHETLKLLEEAKVALSTRYLDGMQESLRAYLEFLSPDAPDAVMDASFEVSLRAGGKTRSTEFFSRGWRDVIGFCTRLALIDALYASGELPCIVLDDPFVNLDDRRMHAARELIERLSSKYQIIYMVCHRGRELR